MLVLWLSIVLSPSSLRAVHKDSFSMIFDNYQNICWDDEKARLDNFAINWQKSPKATGYITVFAGRASCIDEAKYRAKRAKDWVLKVGANVDRVTADRVVIRDGGYREKVETILSIIPSDMTAPKFEAALHKDKVSIHKCVDKVFARVLCLDQK